MFVGINNFGLVHDFYYPYVGQENLTNTKSERHKVGVWVNGRFSWVDDGSWEISLRLSKDALIGFVSWKNSALGIEIRTKDFIHSKQNALVRIFKVKNTTDTQQEVRLFLHQDFQLSSVGRGDTVIYEPNGPYILDYKGKYNLFIYAQTDNDFLPFTQFATGNANIEGKRGTFVDAEDGVLSGNPVEHGSVDSCLGLTCSIDPGEVSQISYWVIAADSEQDALKVHTTLVGNGSLIAFAETRRYWKDWLDISRNKRDQIDPKYQEVVKKSLMIIKAHIDRRGGVLASGDSSIYNYGRDYYCYVWPRDGAFALWPLVRLGYTEELKNYIEFIRDTIHTEGYVRHKYQPDKSIGSTWHPLLHNHKRELAIQEDETAVILVVLYEYLQETNDKDFIERVYSTLICRMADFMANYIDERTGLPHASYDLWEEKFLTSTYTTSVVFTALKIASFFAELCDFPDDALRWKEKARLIESRMDYFFDKTHSYFVKGFLLTDKGVVMDTTLDISSMYGMYMFGPESKRSMVDDTVHVIKNRLLDKTPSGGAPRYIGDNYLKASPQDSSNPWIITTLWIAQYYADRGQKQQAVNYIDWALSKAHASGILSEQINPRTSAPVGVAPLVWSHAELINTIIDLSE